MTRRHVRRVRTGHRAHVHTRAHLSVMLARHPWLRDTDHVGAVLHRAVVWGV